MMQISWAKLLSRWRQPIKEIPGSRVSIFFKIRKKDPHSSFIQIESENSQVRNVMMMIKSLIRQLQLFLSQVARNHNFHSKIKPSKISR